MVTQVKILRTQQPYAPIGALHRIILLSVVLVPIMWLFELTFLVWNKTVMIYDLANGQDVIAFTVMYGITAAGVTVGYHRMMTHKSFEAHPVVKFFLLAAGSMSVESGPIKWTRIHLQHHKKSDKEGDPHSPIDGFIHAHFMWMKRGYGAPEGKFEFVSRDRMAVFFERTFPFWVFLGYYIPYLIAGWSGVFWGGAIRMMFVHHITWSVNSICHTFGERTFRTSDMSRNHRLVALLGWGEGWHNNHHAFPYSADHGLLPGETDFAGLVIGGLERMGLAWNVQRVRPDELKSALEVAQNLGTDVEFDIHFNSPATLRQAA